MGSAKHTFTTHKLRFKIISDAATFQLSNNCYLNIVIQGYGRSSEINRFPTQLVLLHNCKSMFFYGGILLLNNL